MDSTHSTKQSVTISTLTSYMFISKIELLYSTSINQQRTLGLPLRAVICNTTAEHACWVNLSVVESNAPTNKQVFQLPSTLRIIKLCLHAESAVCQKLKLGNFFCVLDPMELKLSNMIDNSKIQKQTYSIFVLFYSKGLLRENDDIKLHVHVHVTGEFSFHFQNKLMHDFERIYWDKFKY